MRALRRCRIFGGIVGANVAVVGLGWAGQNLHLPFFTRDSRIDTVVLVDSDTDKREAVADRFGIEHHFGSLAEAIRVAQPSIVSVATPPGTHFRVCLEALEAGCHVFVEKPFTLDQLEAELLMRLAREGDLQLCVNHSRKFKPGLKNFIGALTGDAIGKVFALERVWNFSETLSPQIQDASRWEHELPAGWWTEHAPHDLYVAYSILGPMQLLGVEVLGRSGSTPWLSGSSIWATYVSASTATFGLRYVVSPGVTGFKRFTAFGANGSLSTNDYAIVSPDGDIGDFSVRPSPGDELANDVFKKMSRKKVFVFGTGSDAEALCSSLDIEVEAFLDNNETRQGKAFLGRPIWPPSTILLCDDSFILIASSFDREIALQLSGLGLVEGHHFVCTRERFSYLFDQGSDFVLSAFVATVLNKASARPVSLEEIRWVNDANIELSRRIHVALRA